MVDDQPRSTMTVGLADEIEGCLLAAAKQVADYRKSTPRSRTTSGYVLGYKGTLITIELVASRVKIVTPVVHTGGK